MSLISNDWKTQLKLNCYALQPNTLHCLK